VENIIFMENKGVRSDLCGLRRASLSFGVLRHLDVCPVEKGLSIRKKRTMKDNTGRLLVTLRTFAAIAVISFFFVSSALADNIPTYPPVPDPNIITFADAPGTCGGAVICSSNGTLGYFNGTAGHTIAGGGVAFDLSTITQWFQIDPDGVNRLAGQTMAEPDGGAGGFLVVNDTGSAVTTFSLTIADNFTSTTPSVGPCQPGPQSGKLCDNFQNHGGSAYAFNTELSGPNINDCTQGSAVGATCQGNAGGVAADFAPGSVTYTWTATPGVSIAAGAQFDITFASWNTGAAATGSQVLEPGSLLLLGTGLSGMAFWRKRRS
jgi:hypothetical protein